MDCLKVGLAVGLLLLAACAGAPKVTVDAAEVQQQFEGKTVAQALEETEAAMARAEQGELAFYSPGFFAVAKRALEEARFLKLAPKETNEDGVSSDVEIFTQLSRANISLEKAAANRPEVKKWLGDVLAVRTSLIAKGIDKSAASEFNDLMDSLDDLFRRIEKNELGGFAQSQKITLRQLRRLEARSVKAVQLDDSIAVLEKAEGLGAGGAAPKSHKRAQRALRNAQTVIERDPNDKIAVKNAVERFSFEANHLLHITNEVKELRSLNHAAMENILLAAESRLLAISDALAQPDPRQKNLREQVELIVNAADKLVASQTAGGTKPRTRHVNKNELEAAHLRIEQLQAQLRDAQAQSIQFKREQKPLNKRIDALERVVIKLNNEKASLEEALAKATAPPAGGVEITPIK
jgi:hypothetical protein